jgi:membrane associated rhomboid family serine protease
VKNTRIIAVFLPSIVLVALIWIAFFVDNYFSLSLWNYGLYPRTLHGLSGILTMPLIHGDIQHIINNTIPLIVLISFLFHFYPTHCRKVVLLIWVTSGLWTWVFARPSYHIGASAVIYGLAAFIFFAGIIIKEKKHIAISLLVVFLYGSIIWGMFPIDLRQSWEGHLTGFLAGTALAFFYKQELRHTYYSPPVIIDEDDEDDEDDENPYWMVDDDNQQQ